MRNTAIVAALAAGLGTVAMAAAATPPAAPTGVGTDVARDATCVGCHADVGAAWAHLSSHSLLHDCVACHKVTGASGAGHASKPACADCHSETSHQGAACGACHDAHGSVNAFLVKPAIVLPSGTSVAVTVTKPEGATKDGLVRAGVSGATAGTGLCEVCHATTAHYDAAGKGTAHGTQWCGECHDHAQGFAAQ